MLESKEHAAIESLWTMHLCGWVEDTIPFRSNSKDGTSRLSALAKNILQQMCAAGAVRLVCDDRKLCQLSPSTR